MTDLCNYSDQKDGGNGNGNGDGDGEGDGDRNGNRDSNDDSVRNVRATSRTKHKHATDEFVWSLPGTRNKKLNTPRSEPQVGYVGENPYPRWKLACVR